MAQEEFRTLGPEQTVLTTVWQPGFLYPEWERQGLAWLISAQIGTLEGRQWSPMFMDTFYDFLWKIKGADDPAYGADPYRQ